MCVQRRFLWVYIPRCARDRRRPSGAGGRGQKGKSAALLAGGPVGLMTRQRLRANHPPPQPPHPLTPPPSPTRSFEARAAKELRAETAVQYGHTYKWTYKTRRCVRGPDADFPDDPPDPRRPRTGLPERASPTRRRTRDGFNQRRVLSRKTVSSTTRSFTAVEL